MSIKQSITANDVLKYLCNKVLNIDMSDKLFMMDMLEDLSAIENLASFRIFVKERFSYERFRYLTGDQKFIKLVQEYKKENAPKLSEDRLLKANNYSSKLFSMITTIMDDLHFTFQTTGKSIEDVDLEKTLEANGFEKHHISILNGVGSKKKLFHLSVYQKEELRASIESIVKRKSLEKEHPQLAKPKSQDMKTLERIRG